MKFDERIKNSIKEIKPDIYMKIRLSAKINEQAKPKKSHMVKRIRVGILAFVVFCGSIVGYYSIQNKDTNKNNFTIIAYADDGTRHILSNKDIKMSTCHIEKNYISNMDTVGLSSMSTGFIIESENIAQATFKSDNYELIIEDKDMEDNHFERDDYYIVKIPLNEDEIKAFSQIDAFEIENKTEKAFIHEMMLNRDLSEYFGDNSMDIENYHVHQILDDSADTVEYYGAEKTGYITSHLYLVKNENYEDTIRQGYEITEKNYDDNDKINDIYLDVNAASEHIKEHPDINLSDLPKCRITITVTFKSGETAEKNILAEFDDEGYLHCSIV